MIELLDAMEKERFAFVLIPFSEDFDDVYKLGIVGACDELPLRAEKVSEQFFDERILDRIYRQIENCDIVIADMSGRNPNVFYEVGYAHAKNKKCILLTNSAEDIPFDLKHHRHIVYKSVSDLREKLQCDLTTLLDILDSEEEQRIRIRGIKVSGDLEKTEYLDTAKVDIAFEIYNDTQEASPEIEAIYINTGSDWTFLHEGTACPSRELGGSPLVVSHHVRPPIRVLRPDTWAEIRLSGQRIVGSGFSGDERKDKYNMSGNFGIRIVTSQGEVIHNTHLDVECEEMPF